MNNKEYRDTYYKNNKEKYWTSVYKQRKKDGLCVQCGGNRDREGIITCSKCFDPKNRNKKRNEWKSKGLCFYCGGQNDKLPNTLCSVCAEKQKKRTEKYQLQIKIDTFNTYGGCFCKCCGESNLVFLTIDHIDGKGAEHRRELRKGKGDSGGGGNKTYHALKKAGYPAGYRVLCFNCNHANHVLGACPHQSDKKEISAEFSALLNNISTKDIPTIQ